MSRELKGWGAVGLSLVGLWAALALYGYFTAEPIDGPPDQFFGLGPFGLMMTIFGLLLLTAAYLAMALIRVSVGLFALLRRWLISN
jgi:hypothetical protein